jgi:hypothetical protein
MGYALPQQPFHATERRGAARSPASCVAHLQTPGGDWRGQLYDLSETGARIQVASPPIPGATALLRWDGHECFCRVVWTTGEMCGVVFDRPISGIAVRDATGPRTGPQASLGRIPLGQKRSRLNEG